MINGRSSAARAFQSLLFVACSGDAFHLADAGVTNQGQMETGGGGFPPLMPTLGNPSEAGASGASEPDPETLDAGSPDATPVPPEPTPAGPCGELRVDDAALANGEVCVARGTFAMGATASAVPAGFLAHAPVHSVLLSAYVIGAHEVTVARYRACVGAGACVAPSTSLAQGCTFTAQPAEHERHPVTCVRWQDAEAFCIWDDARRLPTEAEWERAARGSTSRVYPWGDTFNCTRAVLAGAGQCAEHAGQTPKAVGSEPTGQSPEGAFDLTGNAWEWVADWSGPYTSASAENPTGPASGSARIQRGGGWQTSAADATGYARRAEAPESISPASFRCARDAAP